MMNYLIAYQIEILLGSNALLAAAALIAVQRFRSLVRRNEAFWGSPVGEQLRESTATGTDTALLGFLEHRLNLLQDRIDRIAQPSAVEPAARLEPNPRYPAMPFEYAVRMAKNGAGVDELIRACGLSRAEAKLICRVHGSSGAVETEATTH
ncbi:MAG: DUF2802 domain-containing protein [Woeseiaceae bacterium]|nr:DUF2802 domain-containing protein [Woeseiaceae bacterium]